jgi:hypothetical protein
MATIQRVNFEPVSDVLPIWRRDLSLADAALADPDNALALIDGEWVTIDANYRWVRAADVTADDEEATVRSFPVWHERGRYDRRAMSGAKTTALFRGEYEFDTRVYDATVALGSGAAITTIMQPLKVAQITIGARNYVGLVGAGATLTDASPIVGYVTKLPASNGGKLRFISGYRA